MWTIHAYSILRAGWVCLPEVPTSRSAFFGFLRRGFCTPENVRSRITTAAPRADSSGRRVFCQCGIQLQRSAATDPPAAAGPAPQHLFKMSKNSKFLRRLCEGRATIRDTPCRARWFRIIPALPRGAQRRRRRRAPHCRDLSSCRRLCRCRPPRPCLTPVCAGLARGPIMPSVHVPCSSPTAVVASFLVRLGSTLRG